MKKKPSASGAANRMYKRQPTGQRQSIPFEENGAPNLVKERRRFSYGLCALVISLCLVLGVAAIILVPLLTNGGGEDPFPPSGRIAGASSREETLVSCGTTLEAEAILGYAVVLPTDYLPVGTQLAAMNVVDGVTFEAIYTFNTETFVFRMAQGNEDPGNTSYDDVGTVSLGEIVCRVEGDSENALRRAVWIDQGYVFSFAATTATMLPALVGTVVQGVHSLVAQLPPVQEDTPEEPPDNSFSESGD